MTLENRNFNRKVSRIYSNFDQNDYRSNINRGSGFENSNYAPNRGRNINSYSDDSGRRASYGYSSNREFYNRGAPSSYYNRSSSSSTSRYSSPSSGTSNVFNNSGGGFSRGGSSSGGGGTSSSSGSSSGGGSSRGGVN